MTKRLLYTSDFDGIGSGYLNLSVPLLTGLVNDYGWDVKVIGLFYKGEEHRFPFSVLGCMDFKQYDDMTVNLHNLWHPDVTMVSMDIPRHLQIMKSMNRRKTPYKKYAGIFPVESNPVCVSWAMGLSMLDKCFCISQTGTDECNRLGLNTTHFAVGIDRELWRKPTDEERMKLRKSMGLSDEYVILTVADNQERKNLSGAMEMVSLFKAQNPDIKIKYILVTREHLFAGWNLRDYAQSLGIANDIMIFERGLEFKKLWALYACADVFLLTSKAEGLGMPVLEAMSCDIPVVGTRVSAIEEHLKCSRGFLIDAASTYTDVWGNSLRVFPDVIHGAKLLKDVYNGDYSVSTSLNVKEYLEEMHDWGKAVKTINDELEKML